MTTDVSQAPSTYAEEKVEEYKSDDIIKENAFGNINLFVNFLQDFSGKDEIEIVEGNK